MSTINTYFEDFLKKEPLFINKKILQSNYIPKEIPYREQQIEQIASILAPALRFEKPSNLFVYGKTGTGKTLSIKHTIEAMQQIAKKNNIQLKTLYLNCKLKKVADTEYRLIAQLARDFGEEVPATGLPTEEIYKIFVKALDKEKQIIILILDEIDQLVKKTGDEILYNLTRISSELKQSEVSVIGISNDLVFTDVLDPRVKSSLSEEEVLFPPYNALQLQKILKERSALAFKEGSLTEGVISKCAAYAAREHGDARRALELLRVAGELAERKNEITITVDHIDIAEEKIENDKIVESIESQPKQSQLTLYAIFSKALINTEGHIFTGDVYELYKEYCTKAGLRPLTQRRVSDIIAELDMLGIINTKIISKG
ncbi:MAG: orc1/cdc6 family replication initiation protein, partial [Nanoarchaeota archaeon]|nr:orc1/cdc6 family replication initiation protein [Nanoarchaeota archaeon]